MTELNDEQNGHAAQLTPQWPGNAAPKVSDPEVASIVAALDGLADRPVAVHDQVYTELHDALLEALNRDTPREGKA
ncbi:hypothetical protein [Pseudarthrobacter sulfonivorans]|uniref:hypothetical protein n=1 Tax=Pseudarthrobacter sulfonivorans TaxID=121292 RepID=UPI002104FBC3|nr:hypothetical protein [Pseudarthrobacter sulfonivorans]